MALVLLEVTSIVQHGAWSSMNNDSFTPAQPLLPPHINTFFILLLATQLKAGAGRVLTAQCAQYSSGAQIIYRILRETTEPPSTLLPVPATPSRRSERNAIKLVAAGWLADFRPGLVRLAILNLVTLQL